MIPVRISLLSERLRKIKKTCGRKAFAVVWGSFEGKSCFVRSGQRCEETSFLAFVFFFLFLLVSGCQSSGIKRRRGRRAKVGGSRLCVSGHFSDDSCAE